ncbi:aldo/keto reductase [Rhodococcus globerulus]|uniref:Aldo/keto reductase n=1 Tax=Rhodococcus globerulus TaxID=33008 RepID=A0ABU4C4P4_RHOGO|nr:aldo/keto reductase [Rhodococcus globerulus]MDV6271477.1 aldo/keto reductase [Rhodococcus globerulus]
MPDLKYKKLGTTGLDISPLALGCMSFGEPDRGYPQWTLPEEDSQKIIRTAVDAGINFFDTANSYSHGRSEEIIGKTLREMKHRDNAVIATKALHPMRPGPNGGGLSRKAIFTEIDNSLRRLNTDYIDLYQIHRLDHSTPIEETLEALNDIVKAGKARYLGASSMHAWQFAKALHLQEKNGWTRFVSMQDHYNLLNREEEREMIPLCMDEGIGIIVWSPLARGRLARDWQDTSTHRSAADPFTDQLYSKQNAESDKEIIRVIGQIAKDRCVSRAQVALAWLLHQPVVSAPIIGSSSAAQISDAVGALDIELSTQELTELTAPYTPRAASQGGLTEVERHQIITDLGIVSNST